MRVVAAPDPSSGGGGGVTPVKQRRRWPSSPSRRAALRSTLQNGDGSLLSSIMKKSDAPFEEEATSSSSSSSSHLTSRNPWKMNWDHGGDTATAFVGDSSSTWDTADWPDVGGWEFGAKAAKEGTANSKNNDEKDSPSFLAELTKSDTWGAATNDVRQNTDASTKAFRSSCAPKQTAINVTNTLTRRVEHHEVRSDAETSQRTIRTEEASEIREQEFLEQVSKKQVRQDGDNVVATALGLLREAETDDELGPTDEEGPSDEEGEEKLLFSEMAKPIRLNTNTVDDRDDNSRSNSNRAVISTDDEIFADILEEEMSGRSFDRVKNDDISVPKQSLLCESDSIVYQRDKMCKTMAPSQLMMAANQVEATQDKRAIFKQNKEARSERQLRNISGRFHWRGSKPSSTLSDEEAGHEIAEIAYVLRASLTLQTLVDQEGTPQNQVVRQARSSESAASKQQEVFEFVGQEAMNSLLSLNYGATESECDAQLNLLLFGRYIIGTTPVGRRTFDVSGKYRFASRTEVETTYSILAREESSRIVGSKESKLCVALKATLEVPEAEEGSLSDSIVYTAIVSSHNNGSPGKRCILRRVRHILQFIVGPDQLTVRDILRLMAYCRDYKSEDYMLEHKRDLKQEEKNHTQSDRLNEILFEEYRKRIKAQVGKWLKKLSWERDDIQLSSNAKGHLVSHHPEDILFCAQIEMDVVRESLPQSNVIEVMIDILIEIKLGQVMMRNTLHSDWEEMDIEWICAIINDSATMLEYVEDFSIFGDPKHAFLPTFELKKVRDDVMKGYVELSREATDLLAYSIMKDLEEPVMSKVFSAYWEKEGKLMNCVSATLRDYYGDLSEWLPQYDFSHVCTKCIDILIEDYICATFAEKHEGRPLLDADAVPARLLQDRLILLDFFSHVEEDMKACGTKSHAEKALDIFLALSEIFGAEDPDDVSEELNTVCVYLGSTYCHAAIMHFIIRKTGQYSHKVHKRWDDGLYMAVEEHNDGARLDVNLDHLLEVKHTSSFPLTTSIDTQSRSLDTSIDESHTFHSLEESGSDHTIPSRGCAVPTRGCAANRDENGVAWTDKFSDTFTSLKVHGDKFITVSADGFCWFLDTTTDLCTELCNEVLDIDICCDENEDKQNDHDDENVFMSAVTEEDSHSEEASEEEKEAVEVAEQTIDDGGKNSKSKKRTKRVSFGA